MRTVSAGLVEEAMISQIRQALQTPEMIARMARASERYGSVPPEEVRQAFGSLDRLWDELFPGEQARIVQLLLEEVRVYSDRLDVRLKAEGLEAQRTTYTVQR